VGALDMSGSVWEWIDTLYQPYPADEMLETGLADESDTQPRVRRGGSFYDGLATALRGAKRGSNPPSFELDAGGFRCISEPPVTLQPDQCDEANYQQAGQLVQVGSEALASGHVSYALFLLETTDNALASCIGNAGWQPVVETFNGVDMVQVPAGCFMMGSDDGEADEQPVHEVCFNADYWIDKTEVTRAMYAECVAAGVCTETPDNTYSTRDTQPINNVTWFQARNYCAWRGARLPTEAEWEYAARGPDDWVYPWGDEFALRNVVFQQEFEAADVGSLPAGASWVGALDMSGNVWEWVSSAYKSYPYVPDDGREDLTDVDSVRVWRGGSFYDYKEEDLRAAARGQFTPNYAIYTNGFRCARDE
jgi:formylglycine-generating enzyme required for sulfatase activity